MNRLSGTSAQLTGISCSTDARCVAVGSLDTIVTSADGGMTWTNRSSSIHRKWGVHYDLSSVSCFSADRCVVVGDVGTILTTGDGGATWTSRTAGPTDPLLDISCARVGICVAVGTANFGVGRILISRDDGATWHVSGGNSQWLDGISCTSARHCVAVGVRGTILTSGDGVATWTSRSNPFSGTDDNLGGISCVGGGLCVVLSNNAHNKGGSAILSSTDGGATWTRQNPRITSDLFDISCSSASLCVAVGADGTILQGKRISR